jgi:SAM-dependent methyltransferase
MATGSSQSTSSVTRTPDRPVEYQIGTPPRTVDERSIAYQKTRSGHWDFVADLMGDQASWGAYYHQRLREVYQTLVAPGQRVLELGCGDGDLLAALQPAFGLGIDFSSHMIEGARRRHPDLHFVAADAHDLSIAGSFDVIILSDLVNDLWDVQAVLEQLTRLSTPRTRLIINTYSRFWELPLRMARRAGMARPNLEQNWLTPADVGNLLELAGFEPIRHWQEVICPLPLPLIGKFANRVLAKTWPTNLLALSNFIVARPGGALARRKPDPTVSIVIPARNEAGNIAAAFERVPEMGAGTELIFVEGHSKDDTYAVIEQAITGHPERSCKLLRQSGKGKGDAVRAGFAAAEGDILMILDADLTMPPEDLPRYFEILRSGHAEFVNGVRLVYPMEKEAMRYLNLLGNKFFSLAFSYLLGQPIKDTLCGTKVLWREDYEHIARNRAYFGDFDPFGDFDLIFGAARLSLKITDLPIRYRERSYGDTNIHRWKHGLLLLRMTGFAAKRLKFV